MSDKPYDDDLTTATMSLDGARVPLPVGVAFDETVREYFLRRAHQHVYDNYCGVPMLKFPEDLRVYEHLLWASRASTVVELGCLHGGSALWFRDRLRALAKYGDGRRIRVIGVDRDVAPARARLAALDPDHGEDIVLIEGDLADPALVAQVRALVPDGASCLVTEDAAHKGAVTASALDGYAELVQPLGFFVVEDGFVDGELRSDFPFEARGVGGVVPAIRAWLHGERGAEFVARRDLELYGITTNPSGILQRNAALRARAGAVIGPAAPTSS